MRRSPRGALAPFAVGARTCIGGDFAPTEATLALAAVAARRRLTPAPGTRVRPAARSIPCPRG
ncbi:cytochrome P450 [Kitasatospora sp. NPDC086801]|uniref:cytochrome P450 n=1 Tax=Kitasatospora sp. NPDC086801 TaxID=3364066 RepID=UPI003825221F